MKMIGYVLLEYLRGASYCKRVAGEPDAIMQGKETFRHLILFLASLKFSEIQRLILGYLIIALQH